MSDLLSCIGTVVDKKGTGEQVEYQTDESHGIGGPPLWYAVRDKPVPKLLHYWVK